VFFTKDSLWRCILVKKYTTPLDINDWLRKENKQIQNSYVEWKNLVQIFPIIGKRLAWKVGSRVQVRAAIDAIVSCGNNDFLLREVIYFLRNVGRVGLNRCANPFSTSI
jgi:hypothetical protein